MFAVEVKLTPIRNHRTDTLILDAGGAWLYFLSPV